MVFVLIIMLVFSDLGHFLTLKTLPAVSKAEAATLTAIKVESFDENVTSDGTTFALTNDVGATTSAFIRINTGTRKTSAGPTASTGNTGPNIGTVGLVLSDTATVTAKRVDATEVKVMGEVWRYEGPAGGSNEFIVRDRVAVTLTGASQSTAIPGVSDVTKVIPFITGYTVNDSSISNWMFATIAAHMDDSGNLVVSRNNSGTTATVYVDVVEFTGSDWSVCHGYSAAHDTAAETVTLNTDPDGQGGSVCDVSDWGTATIVEATMEGDSSETGLSDTLALVRPGANTTTVVFDTQLDTGARNDGGAWIHVLQNDNLVVNRNSDTNLSEGNGSYGTASWPTNATTTADLDTLALEWFTDTSGVGTAHMRGGLHARITDALGTIQHWIHRSGNTVGVEYGVVELGGLVFNVYDVIVGATGTHASTVRIPTHDQYQGGSFVIQSDSGSRNVTSITITESGSIDASTGINNIELYYDLDTSAPYDCASESFTGTSTESQYGTTDTNGFSGANGTASFTDTVGISTAGTMCVYVVYDVTEAAADSETVSISIANPTVDVGFSDVPEVGPSEAVAPLGSTTVQNAELSLVHYHWLENDGVEGSASATEAEDTPAIGFANGTINRLRLQVSNEGSTSSDPTTLRLEYATSTGDCVSTTGWEDVGASGGAWDMSDSVYFALDGLDSTDVTTANGGTTNENSTFLTPNGALKDTSSELASALTFLTDNFLELEFAIEPTVDAVDGSTYCFRLTDAGTPLRQYAVYPEGTVSADITVSAAGAHVSTLDVGTVAQYLGGNFTVQRTGGTRTVTNIVLTEQGTVDALNDLSNIALYYDLDTSAPYDCASESLDGNEVQFGATSTAFSSSNGTASFSGSETVNSTRSLCLYTVLDVDATATDGQTILVEINNPSTDVVVTSSSVGPSSALAPTGSTAVTGPVRTQTHYHWRNDNGSETDGGATSATGEVEDTPFLNLAKETTTRLRLQVSNEGSVVSAASTYQLEYGTKITSCDAVGTWIDVGAVGGAWDMSASTNIADGNTTNVAVAYGGMTDENTTFVGTGALRETTSQSGSITLSNTEFTELEYSIEATAASGYDTTYCFRVTDQGTALESYIAYPEVTTREQQDFYIQRGTERVTGTSLTLVAGVDYEAPAGTSTAFVRITNAQMTGAGTDAGGGNQNADDVTAYISDQSDLTTSFTIARPSAAANDTRVSWEIVEFIGLPGSDNEIQVLGAGTAAVTSGNALATGTVTIAPQDNADVVVFITGQYNEDAGRNNFNDGLFTASWSSATDQPVFERADTDSNAGVSYAVVEFSGLNWNVERVEHTYTAAGTTETESITVIPSVTQAFVHAQKRVGTGLSGLDENGHIVWLSSIGAVSFELYSTADTPNEHTSVAWIISNTQIGSGAMYTYQSSGDVSTGGPEPGSYSLAIGGTVNTTNASIFANNISAGTGTAYPRGYNGYTITSETQYEFWESDSGQPISYRVEVVDWPVAETALRQNYYRFYVNNSSSTPTDAWPVGATDLGENTSVTGSDDPLGEGEVIRIRMSLLVKNATLPADVTAFKLQYAARDTTCSAATVWTDLGAPGSGEVWRGYNDTPTDGDTLPNTLLSVSDVSGSYEEANNSAVNPNAVDVDEDIEYDWVVEHNGAVQRTDYCFRMVYSDDTLLSSYNYYPTLRTTGYTPVVSQWRWYDDEYNLTPTTTLAAENVAPIDIGNQNVLKLRTTVAEVENEQGVNTKFYLEYSEYPDFRDGGFVPASIANCTATATWCYADGAGIDNASIDNAVLSDADTCAGGVGIGCGTYNEASSTAASLVHPAGTTLEFEYTLRQAGALAGAVYYFRLVDANTVDVVAASSSYPSLVTQGPSLVFTLEGISAGTDTEGVTTDATTTPVSVSFGSLPIGTAVTAAQRLTVDTNATDGYQVLAFSRQGLYSTIGSTIADISSSNSTPAGWSIACEVTADGCFGYHVGDDVLAGGSTRFAPTDSFAAFETTPREVMYSSIPINDTTDIVYKVEVQESQPAGDYETNIVYLAIPTF